MTPTIVVPLDGSTLAERALPFATRLAQAASAHTVLARVVTTAVEPVEATAREIQVYLDDAAAKLREHGLSVETTTACGTPAAEILGIAHDRPAALLVMSTHGRSGIGRWLYGSVADEVLRRADCPVVLVPPDARTELPLDRPPHILVPLDGSPLAEAALGPAGEWASLLGAEIILMQVVFWPPLIYGDGAELMELDADKEVGLANEYLHHIAARWQTTTTLVHCRALAGQHTAHLIAQVAAEEHADLIAMAAHGRGGLARLVLGSVATGTLQRANVPVLVVRPQAHDSAAAA